MTIGTLYFIREMPSGPIKIGWTRTAGVERRWACLQTGNPRQIAIIATIPGVSATVERRWHGRFLKDRIRGEWFRPSDGLIAAIGSEATAESLVRYKPLRALPGERARQPWVRSLRRWVKRDGLTIADLAARLGYSEIYTKSLLQGGVQLSLPTAKRFEMASGGLLKAERLLLSADKTRNIRAFLKRASTAA